MISVSSINFCGEYSKTKNGNYYKKKNTGKHIGTTAGLLSGIGLSFLPEIKLFTYATALRMFPESLIKSTIAAKGITLTGITAITLLFRGLGAIPDNIINKKRKAKADHIA